MKRLILSVGFILVLGGALLWSQQGIGWYRVATLANDVSAGETLLSVKWTSPTAQLDQPILIEARDGTVVEIVYVEHIFDNHIVVKRRIQNDFLAGSRIYR